MKINRYPGVKPFTAEEQALFFGRDRDITDLCDLIRVEKTCVLFGKSGYGKSSLLQAGVMPRLSAEWMPVEVRFGEYAPGQSLPPLESLRRALAKRAQPNPNTTFAIALPNSLWVHFKKYRSTAIGNGYLLVFDQFEEFFSYPAEQQRDFREQLSELLNDELPEHLREAARELPREQRRLLAAAFDIRLLVALRSDRLHELDQMKDYLPALLHKRYELRAFTPEQAREAIVQPAKAPALPPLEGTVTSIVNNWEATFISSPFFYSESALQEIINYLSHSTTNSSVIEVEGFQLQIICGSIESMVIEGFISDQNFDGLPDVLLENLPDFRVLFAQYYERLLTQLPVKEQTIAHHVLENGLVRINPLTEEGCRLSVDKGSLLQQYENQGLTSELLHALESTFLIRRELNTVGGYSYELSHDSLLEPLLLSRKKRLRTIDERQKSRVNKLLLVICTIVVLGLVFLWNPDGEKTQEKSIQLTQIEPYLYDEILLYNSFIIVKAELEQAERDFNINPNTWTVENLNKAESNAEKLVNKMLENAIQRIDSLDFRAATSNIHLASELVSGHSFQTKLGSMRNVVADILMEPTFFYIKSKQWAPAYTEISTIAMLLDKWPPNFLGWKTGSDLHVQLSETLQRLDSSRYAQLHTRYYGDLIEVPGGSFAMGISHDKTNEKSLQEVRLLPFLVASSETTLGQYYLFCMASGYPQPYIPFGWRAKSDNPIVNVSWYDAVMYCNWCSEQFGLQSVYAIDSMDKEQNYWIVKADFEKNGYRLLSEAEWEYAARGGTEFEFAGDSILTNVGWYDSNSDKKIHEVAQKKPNSFGLYDMSGNVWEWCWDEYESNPQVPLKGYRIIKENGTAVLRGGSWLNNESSCGVTSRNKNNRITGLNYVGFRIGRAVGRR